MKVRIMGVDPGSIKCGWGVLDREDGQVSYVDSGTIKPKGSWDLNHRLAWIFGALGKAIDEQMVPSDANAKTMACEMYFVRDSRGATVVAQVRGVIRLLAGIYDLRYNEVAPQSVKKKVHGYGLARKEDLRDALMKRIPGIPKDRGLDEYDALAVAAHYAIL